MFWKKRERYEELERALGELKESVLSITEERDEYKEALREIDAQRWELFRKCEECERELEQAKDKYQTLLDSLPQPGVKGIRIQARLYDATEWITYDEPLRVEVFVQGNTSTLLLYDGSGKQIGAVHQVLRWEYVFEEVE